MAQIAHGKYSRHIHTKEKRTSISVETTRERGKSEMK
jgi:hypothetical protein